MGLAVEPPTVVSSIVYLMVTNKMCGCFMWRGKRGHRHSARLMVFDKIPGQLMYCIRRYATEEI